MKVVATEKGYFGGQVREKDEQFDVPEGTKGSWFKAVDAAPAGKSGKSKGKSDPNDTGDDEPVI